MRFSLIGLGLAAAAISFSAAPSRAQSGNWQGFYAGVAAGVAVGTAKMNLDPTGGFLGPAAGDIADGNFWRGTTDLDTVDPTGSLQGGYQIGYGRFRFGLEGEAGYLGLRESASRTAFVPAQGSTFRLDQKIETDFFASLRPRVGYVPETFSGNVLLFATGGATLTRARIDQRFTQLNLVYNSDGISEDELLVGWVAGGGAEYALSEAWSLKAEYLYSDLGTIERNNVAGFPPNFAGFTTNNQADLTSHIFRVGIAYHF
jgi:outer membrane immunogenic protein